MRLIDANALLRHKRKMSGAEFGGEFWDEAVLASDIKSAPTVDAVEVVRCRDCKHQRKIWHADKRMKEKGCWIYSCKGNSDPFVSHTVNGYNDEYCCYGERKKGENDE